jgi:hypothetical protein
MFKKYPQFIDRQQHEQAKFELINNNLTIFITVSGTTGSIQNAKMTKHTATLCIAGFPPCL